MVTNRQCSSPQREADACTQSRWFLTAALGKRRTYFEGADYAVDTMPPPTRARARIELSRRLVDVPSRADAKILWREGVVNGQVEVPAGGQLKVPTPCGWSALLLVSSLGGSGLAHPVGLSAGDHGGGVVQEPVQEADRGGVLW